MRILILIFTSILIAFTSLAQINCAGDTTIQGIFYRVVYSNPLKKNSGIDTASDTWRFIPASRLVNKKILTVIKEDWMTDMKNEIFVCHTPAYFVVDTFKYLPKECRDIVIDIKEIFPFPLKVPLVKVKDTTHSYYVQMVRSNVIWQHLKVTPGTPIYQHPRTNFINRVSVKIITDYYYPKSLLSTQLINPTKDFAQ